MEILSYLTLTHISSIRTVVGFSPIPDPGPDFRIYVRTEKARCLPGPKFLRPVPTLIRGVIELQPEPVAGLDFWIYVERGPSLGSSFSSGSR
jgi:hypothetical protein